MIINVFCIKEKYRKLKEYFSKKENQLEYIKNCDDNDMNSLDSGSNCRSTGTTSTIGYNSKLFDHVILNGDSGTVCFGYGLNDDQTKSNQIDEYYDSNENMISAVFHRDKDINRYNLHKHINRNKRLDFSDKTHSNNIMANNFVKKHVKYIRRKT